MVYVTSCEPSMCAPVLLLHWLAKLLLELLHLLFFLEEVHGGSGDERGLGLDAVVPKSVIQWAGKYEG